MTPKNMVALASWHSGVVEACRPSARIIFFCNRGFLAPDGAIAMCDYLREAVKVHPRDKMTVFLDWSELQDYATASRKILMACASELRQRVGAFHILVASKLVSMGVAVSARLLGEGIHAYTDPVHFDRVVNETVKRLRL